MCLAATPIELTRSANGSLQTGSRAFAISPRTPTNWPAADPRARRLCPLAERGADPSDLLRVFPAEPTRMSPISTRVNEHENAIVEPIESFAA